MLRHSLLFGADSMLESWVLLDDKAHFSFRFTLTYSVYIMTDYDVVGLYYLYIDTAGMHRTFNINVDVS